MVQLLPTGAALLPVVWFEFFGLPPAQRAAWGAEAAPAGAIELGLSCGVDRAELSVPCGISIYLCYVDGRALSFLGDSTRFVV